jgi:RNA-directed DNA polymerase
VKRHGHLFEAVVAYGNLLAAFKRARQGCGWGPESARFFYHLETRLLSLQRDLASGHYRPSPYRFFEVHDPKRRTIAVAPFGDRVVHHAIVAVLSPVYERSFIFDSYATRKDKGTHAAVRRAQQFLRRWPWYLRMDVEKFFDSVSHDILLALLERKLKDRRLLDLLERLLRNSSLPGIGLPIGNLTSQFLANVYLDPLDHLIKDRWQIRGYLRYMDDWVLFDQDPRWLKAYAKAIEHHLRTQLGLHPKPSGTWINRASHGLSFVGMRIFRQAVFPRGICRRRCLKRMARRLDAWREGYLDDAALAQSQASALGHLRYFAPALPVHPGLDPYAARR